MAPSAAALDGSRCFRTGAMKPQPLIARGAPTLSLAQNREGEGGSRSLACARVSY